MLPSQRELFDVPREICYFNAAGWSPLPLATIEAARKAVARKGRPWLIDAEFQALIPPLAQDELRNLEASLQAVPGRILVALLPKLRP